MDDDFELAPDVDAWFAVWQAWLKDRRNGVLEDWAGTLLDDILADRGIDRRP